MSHNEQAAAEREYYHRTREIREEVYEEVLESVKDDLTAVLAYMWPHEERDYEEQDDEGRASHIFQSMQRLATWLEETEKGS